jgi:deoxyhypusine synthase
MMSMLMELTKEIIDKDVLQVEYDRIRMEQDEATHMTERVKQMVERIYNIILEVPREEYSPLEEYVTKIKESIQGFHTKITELEMCQIPSTPPEEGEQREKMTTVTIDNIKILEA